LLGVDPGSVDTSRARPNASLGMPETEFLRRLNEALPAEVPDWFYMWNVKEAVAHTALAARPADARLVLPADREGWAKEQGDALVAGLRGSGYDLIGDLDELLPRPAAEPYASPASQPAERVLDAAVDAAAALVINQYHKAHPAAKPQQGQAGQRGLVSRVESTAGASPWLKRTMRDMSSRFALVRWLRIRVWRAMERRRAPH
jgi:hypothetical protein